MTLPLPRPGVCDKFEISCLHSLRTSNRRLSRHLRVKHDLLSLNFNHHLIVCCRGIKIEKTIRVTAENEKLLLHRGV
jgi:hypothetical protein